MNNRLTPLLDYGMAFVLLIGVIWIVIQPTSLPSTDDLIEKAKTSDGKKINKGPQMIIHLWSLDCLPCKRDAQILQRFHRKHEDYQIIGINLDGFEESNPVNNWAEELKLSYQIATSEMPQTRPRIPSTIIINSDLDEEVVIEKPLSYRQLLGVTNKDR